MLATAVVNLYLIFVHIEPLSLMFSLLAIPKNLGT